MSEAAEAGYQEWRVGWERLLPRLAQSEQQLLLLAGLPLVDGVFAGAVASGRLSDPLVAAAFGVNVFSGAGCLACALALEGGVRARLSVVARVYALVLVGAWLVAAAAPLLRAVLLPSFEAFAALVVLGVAFELAGVSAAPLGPPPAPVAARWWWALRVAGQPQVVVVLALLASLLDAAVRRPQLTGLASPSAVGLAAIAVLSGVGLTLLGALFGAAARPFLDVAWIRRAGAAALAVVALAVLGAPIPAPAPLALLLLGLVLSVFCRVVRPVLRRCS